MKFILGYFIGGCLTGYVILEIIKRGVYNV